LKQNVQIIVDTSESNVRGSSFSLVDMTDSNVIDINKNACFTNELN